MPCSDRLQPITTHITWMPGGAQRDSNGEGVPWPWGRSTFSPVIRAAWSTSVLSRRDITKSEWPFVVAWCDPADLGPPKWE